MLCFFYFLLVRNIFSGIFFLNPPLNFTVNLGEEVTMSFIIKKAKETTLDFSQETLRAL